MVGDTVRRPCSISCAPTRDARRTTHAARRTTHDDVDVDVVLVFLPAEVVARLIGPLLARLRPGTRVLAHEQAELDAQPAPQRSTLLVTDAGVTVVHEWRA